MEPRISLICLGVKDLERSLQFYKEGLGLPTTRSTKDGIIFFQTNGVGFELFPYAELAKDISEDFDVPRSKFSGITMAHNVRTKQEVDQILERAQTAGAKIEKPAHSTEWGGYSGYFSDPDGYIWEVAYGAFDFNDDGSLIIT